MNYIFTFMICALLSLPTAYGASDDCSKLLDVKSEFEIEGDEELLLLTLTDLQKRNVFLNYFNIDVSELHVHEDTNGRIRITLGSTIYEDGKDGVEIIDYKSKGLKFEIRVTKDGSTHEHFSISILGKVVYLSQIVSEGDEVLAAVFEKDA